MAGNLDTLKKKFLTTYQASMAADGALDLFDPSVEALLLPFMSSDARVYPVSEYGVECFKDYFTRAETSRGAEQPGDVAFDIRSPCERRLDLWSIPRPCLRVQGNRARLGEAPAIDPADPNVRGFTFTQLFMGDLVWLFYHERMGIHRMVGAILDDFVTKGRFPIRPNSYEGLIIEAMVREVKSGLSSTVRERDTSYRRCLGWTSEAGSKLDGQDAPKNTSFSVIFHRLIELALGYYNERRLASAIQNTLSIGKPSVATLTTIRDTISDLRKAFDPFKYGRNHTHTLMGIVWTISGLELLTRLRNQLGIPEPYDRADELIPAAYDLLVGTADRINGNRFTAHRDCANSGRHLLLHVQGMDMDGTNVPDNSELAEWLNDVEPLFENYRTAYRVLTGVDLGQQKVSVVQAA